MEMNNAVLKKTINTEEGFIVAYVNWSNFWSLFQLFVDGSLMCSSPDKNYVINEFNNL
jgi:hypothetical protein